MQVGLMSDVHLTCTHPQVYMSDSRFTVFCFTLTACMVRAIIQHYNELPQHKYVTHNEGMLALVPTSFAHVVALLRMSKVLLIMQAFKNYDEAGAVRRIQCLKYLVLANMLMESSVDPFDAQEAKPYKSDGEVLAMTNLVNAYQENNIKEFEKILRTNKSAPLTLTLTPAAHFSSLLPDAHGSSTGPSELFGCGS